MEVSDYKFILKSLFSENSLFKQKERLSKNVEEGESMVTKITNNEIGKSEILYNNYTINNKIEFKSDGKRISKKIVVHNEE